MITVNENEIVLNNVVIGKVFEQVDGSYEVWIPHGLVCAALELDTAKIVFTSK